MRRQKRCVCWHSAENFWDGGAYGHEEAHVAINTCCRQC
eukprot:jgi/Antlo1/292/542